MAKKFTTDSPSIDEIQRLMKPNVVTVPINLDPDVKHRIDKKMVEIDKLKGEIDRAARKGGGSLADKGPEVKTRKLVALEEELATLYEEADEKTVEFELQDIGRFAYDQLISQHPPTEEQVKEYENEAKRLGMTLAEIGGLAYNPDTFPAHLIAATSKSPKIPLKNALEIMNGREAVRDDEGNLVENALPSWSEENIEKLFYGALQACKERTSIPFTKPGIDETLDSGLNSITALSEESVTESS